VPLLQLSRIPEAVGAAVFPAGSLYPLRFVHALLSLCLSRGHFQLFTHTPVQSMQKEGSHWTLQTSRGSLAAKKVILATNGYSRALLPSLDTFLLSHRAHCSSIVPPTNFSGSDSLKSTCSIVRAVGDYEYLVQRPTTGSSDNAFILGGGNTIVNREQEIDTYDDSYVNPALPNYFASYPPNRFKDWNKGEGQLTHTWTGIQGYTRDSLPLVGPSLEDEDLYLCLGHHGHGMARAATCAKGLVLLLLTEQKNQTDEEWEEITLLPACYRWTQTRANRTDVDCRFEF
jgi:glycine/D-amino acid oxidase-like deaminating enzyme